MTDTIPRLRDCDTWTAHDYMIVERALKYYLEYLVKRGLSDDNGTPLDHNETKELKSDKLHIKKLLENEP